MLQNSIVKIYKPRYYINKLTGHKDGLILLYSPEGLQGQTLYSNNGIIRSYFLINVI